MNLIDTIKMLPLHDAVLTRLGKVDNGVLILRLIICNEFKWQIDGIVPDRILGDLSFNGVEQIRSVPPVAPFVENTENPIEGEIRRVHILPSDQSDHQEIQVLFVLIGPRDLPSYEIDLRFVATDCEWVSLEALDLRA